MSVGQAPPRQICRWSAARVIVLANFLLIALGVVLDRVGGRAVDSALRDAGMDSVLALSLQLWLASSTLLATAFFAWSLRSRREGGPEGLRARRSLVIDGALVLMWWVTVLSACVYGHILGLAA